MHCRHGGNRESWLSNDACRFAHPTSAPLLALLSKGVLLFRIFAALFLAPTAFAYDLHLNRMFIVGMTSPLREQLLQLVTMGNSCLKFG